MGVLTAYTILALLLLALSIGLYTPKRWKDLSKKHVKFLKIGCFFGFLLIVANIVGKLI